MKRRYKPGSRPIPDRCGATRKARHTTEAAALRSLHQRQHEARVDGKRRRQERRAYKCWQCQGWHLTSQERKT